MTLAAVLAYNFTYKEQTVIACPKVRLLTERGKPALLYLSDLSAFLGLPVTPRHTATPTMITMTVTTIIASGSTLILL